MRSNVNTVQVSVQSVQAGLVILEKGPINQSAVDSFAQLAQQAHDSIDGVRQSFATSDTSGTVGNAEVEVFTAANDLKNAMGAFVTYAGTPNAATLASLTSQYNNARGEWNQGVDAIWMAAGESGPPTI